VLILILIIRVHQSAGAAPGLARARPDGLSQFESPARLEPVKETLASFFNAQLFPKIVIKCPYVCITLLHLKGLGLGHQVQREWVSAWLGLILSAA